jgi:hypothetical protein
MYPGFNVIGRVLTVKYMNLRAQQLYANIIISRKYLPINNSFEIVIYYHHMKFNFPSFMEIKNIIERHIVQDLSGFSNYKS